MITASPELANATPNDLRRVVAEGLMVGIAKAMKSTPRPLRQERRQQERQDRKRAKFTQISTQGR